MTVQSFEAFVEELERNETLRAEAKALAHGENGVPLSELAEFAAAKGYEFSVEDVSVELSDEELDAVAGGLKWQPLKMGTAHKSYTFSLGLAAPSVQTGGKMEPKSMGGEVFLKWF